MVTTIKVARKEGGIILYLSFLLALFVFNQTTICSQDAPKTIWWKTYGGRSSEGAFSIQQTKDSGYIVAGRTKSFGVGKSDFYIIKLSPEGPPEPSYPPREEKREKRDKRSSRTNT